MRFRAALRFAAILTALSLSTGAVRQPVDDTDSNMTVGPAAPLAQRLPSLPEPFLEAATALRLGDYARSREILSPLSLGEQPTNHLARLVLGLHAYDSGQASEAVQLLSLDSKIAFLEDWRLLALAESAHLLDEAAIAEDSLASLVIDLPTSPLRPLAIQRAAEIAAAHEVWLAALGWIEQARSEPLPSARAGEIERLAWEIGKTTQRVEFLSDTAKRLLVDHPLLASELEVLEFFDLTDEEVDWSRLLTTEDLCHRARNLLDRHEPEQALITLASVPESERDLRWSLLHTAALTDDHKGMQALEMLRDLKDPDAERQAELVWQRALAALDASKVRRGRTNLSQRQRQQMQELALESFEEVVRSTSDKQLSLRSLQMLFAELSDEEDAFDLAFSTLQRLQQMDSSDTTGARYLWRLGWQAYIRNDLPVAIGYWSELGSMYGGTGTARSGRYWTARAHEALGHSSRAREIYREILAVGTTDFYSRHAANRLDERTAEASTIPTHPTVPWPQDAVLERALWLSDLGLDELGLLELEALRGTAERRAFCAAEAVLLGRSGLRRDSIRSLACAFPSLGRADQTVVPEEALQLYYPLDFRDIIERSARKENLSPYLVFAMIRQESAFDASARSWAGARGLMQLMPATGREVARSMGLRYSTSRLEDPDFSVRLGTRYFRQVLEIFDGNQELALAGYNGGPYRIKRLWRQAGTSPELDRFVEGLTLDETKTYVKRIVLFEDSYLRLYGGTG